MENKNSLIDEEFEEFAAPADRAVPAAWGSDIFRQVHSDLSPAAGLVFAKAAAVHAAVGTLTLAACPQFGFSLTGKSGLMAFFMAYGEGACTLACGVVFTFFSLLLVSLTLRPEEIRTLIARQAVHLPLLAMLSLFVFAMLGAELLSALTLLWALGAVAGGALSLRAGWMARTASPGLR